MQEQSYIKKLNTPSVGSTNLDTLVELRKAPTMVACSDPKAVLLKRARSKFISNALSLSLKDLRSDLEKSYFRTYGCASALQQHEDGKITAKYCKNRWCLTCNRIRTAKLIKGYTTPLKGLTDRYFVTLTIPNVKGDELREEVKRMIRTQRKIKDMFRKQGFNVTGIRKLECTYNATRKDFHPHFHFIVAGKDSAQALINEWLQRYPDADRNAQDMRPANDESIYELFKYFTKIISKDPTHIQALDVIFRAMQGLRVFQPMGIKLVSEEIEELDAVILGLEQRETTWAWIEHDWIDIETGETLTGYEPSDRVREIVERFKITVDSS